MDKRIRSQAILILFAVILILISVSAGTYAWFTFRPNVNVDPISGTIGKTAGSILISNSEDGPFAQECEINPSMPAGGMRPLSTGNLEHFYGAAMMADETVVSFQNADSQVDSSTIHGKIYIKTENGACNIYLNRSALDFGTDVQALAAMRLGLKITTPEPDAKVIPYIFRLDDMADLSTAEKSLTIPEEYAGMVVASEKAGDMVRDPAVNISAYGAEKNANADTYTVPDNILFTLNENQVAGVEFWLYLEGCDENCTNAAQFRNVALSLSFYGEAVVPGGRTYDSTQN